MQAVKSCQREVNRVERAVRRILFRFDVMSIIETLEVEIGDGQVSDLVGWTPEAFAGMWLRAERE